MLIQRLTTGLNIHALGRQSLAIDNDLLLNIRDRGNPDTRSTARRWIWPAMDAKQMSADLPSTPSPPEA